MEFSLVVTSAPAHRCSFGIFVGHHERTGASLFLSERGLLRGTRVQRKTADQQWDNEFDPKVSRSSVDAHRRRA